MMNSKYSIAYSEILEILKHIPIEDYKKIPKNEIELFKAYADNNYTFNYDTSKTLKEQNVSDITQGIIILLFRDYWATDIQKEKIIAKQNYDRHILEEQKMKFYPNDIFKRKKVLNFNDISEKNDIYNSKLPVEVKKKNWFQNIIRFTKRLFFIK